MRLTHVIYALLTVMTLALIFDFVFDHSARTRRWWFTHVHFRKRWWNR